MKPILEGKVLRLKARQELEGEVFTTVHAVKSDGLLILKNPDGLLILKN